ncbi:MAG: FAD-dependent oxidoreductase [Candidatus Dormibacteria bacterium]
MSTAESATCVVVGGGWAGMVAARRMQQLGLASVVLEKGEVEGGEGNVRISGGLLHVAWESPDAATGAKLERLVEETDGEIDPAVARALAERSSGLISWLTVEGVDMRPKSDAPYARWALYPHRPGMGRRLTGEYGPDRAMLTLYARFRAAGGDIRLGTRATSLERSGAGMWRVHWRRADAEGSIVASAVVFADGGFQANPELLARYIGPNAGLCLLRAMRSGSGDALRMLTDAGAAIVGLGRVYGHMLSHDALYSDELWPFPPLDELCLRGLVVGRNGTRFSSERDHVEGLVTRLARSDDPRGFTAVFDDSLWESAGQDNPFGMAVANPELVRRGGHFLTAYDIPTLASQLDMEPLALQQSIDAHNAAPSARGITTLPFHAARVVPGITFTMGGPRINAHAEILDVDGEPLPGLYAAGSTAGGVHGGPRGGYIGGLASAATFGLVAAESARRSRAPAVPASGAAAMAQGGP